MAHRVPEDVKLRLKAPLGVLIRGAEVSREELIPQVRENNPIIAVGDKVTETLISYGMTPDVQVVDKMEKREKRIAPKGSYQTLLIVENPAGTITDRAVETVKAALDSRKPTRILVRGEEDLLTLLFMALSPEGAVILYGQPNEGVVVVKVSSSERTFAVGILREIGVGSRRIMRSKY